MPVKLSTLCLQQSTNFIHRYMRVWIFLPAQRESMVAEHGNGANRGSKAQQYEIGRDRDGGEGGTFVTMRADHVSRIPGKLLLSLSLTYSTTLYFSSPCCYNTLLQRIQPFSSSVFSLLWVQAFTLLYSHFFFFCRLNNCEYDTYHTPDGFNK